MEKAAMKFNTTSYLAGVGSVVVVLSTGFAGGYFIANPKRVEPPNRLQRLAAEDHSAPATTTVKPEVVAAVAPAAAATPAVDPPAQQAVAQPASPAPASPVEAKTPEPAPSVAARETTAPAADKADTEKVSTQKASPEKGRAAEARYAERKRGEARKVAEQQRKQRELDVATVAVRRIIHDRDAPEIVENDSREAPAPAMSQFNLFDQE
jgi:type IV secretory pathway VirB10-like protein